MIFIKTEVSFDQTRLVGKFSDPLTKIYLLFVQSVIPTFDIYNTFL